MERQDTPDSSLSQLLVRTVLRDVGQIVTAITPLNSYV
jgi:hypothetical protein